MIEGALADITYAKLTELVGRAREGRTLEFKSRMPETAKLIQGVSALANTAGGDFVIGVEAPDGVVASIKGIEIENLDKKRLAVEESIRNGVEPRLPRLDIHGVPCPDAGNFVLVIRTARSWIGPHRVIRDSRFYGRNSGGKYPLDVSELRTAFLLGAQAEERIRRFQADRISKVVEGRVPVPLGPAAVILHVIPAPALTAFGSQDFVATLQDGTHFPLPLEGPGGGNQFRFNLDGMVNSVLVRNHGIYSYAQMFRSGAIEGALPLGLRDDGKPYFVGSILAHKLVAAARQYASVLNSLEVAFPVFVMVSFYAEHGFFMRSSDTGGGWRDNGPLTGPAIILPEVAIESSEANIANALRPALDALWNGFGAPACELYSSSGDWIGRS